MMKTFSEKGNHSFHPKVLICCGNGYTFDEIYQPIIKDNCNKWDIYLLMNNYYLSEASVKKIDQSVSQGKLISWQIIPELERFLSLNYYKRMFSIIRSFKEKQIDLLLIGNDVSTTDRYLINLAKSLNVMVVIASTGNIWRVLYEYRKVKGFEAGISFSSKVERVFQHKNSMAILKALSGFVRRRIAVFMRKIKTKPYYYFHHYFMPFILTRKIFRKSKYDRFAFTSGRADAVLVYERTEIDAVRTVIPIVKKLFIAKHPSTDLCQCVEDSKAKSEKKLLICFNGNLETELKGEKFERWSIIVKRAVELTGVKEIDLRFHPRTSEKVIWPNQFVKRVESFGCRVRVSNALEECLPDIICNYIGMIAGPSGSLRVARAICKNLFVVGLPNCSDGGKDDQAWILGDAEGISWIHEGEELEMEHLKMKEIAAEEKPSVSDILNTLLLNKYKLS